MGKNVEITMIERSSDLSESDTETDAIENGRRELGIHEALLIANHQPEASVGRWYLLFLTCGVGGYVAPSIKP